MRTGWAIAAACVLSTSAPGPANSQADPFGALYGASGGGGRSPPGGGPSRVGSQGVSTAVGASYAGAGGTGSSMSLAQITFLPKVVAPFPVELQAANAKYLKNRPRIAIPGYALAFSRTYKVFASAAGSGSDLVPRSTQVATTLVGFPESLQQQLADEAYADLVSRLKAAGVEVVAAAEVQGAPHMQKLQRLRTQNGHDGVKAWTTWGAGEAPLIRGYALDEGLATSGPSIALGQVSKELDAIVLIPELIIDHIGFETSGRALYRGSASIDAQLGFQLGQSTVQLIWGNERGGNMWGSFRVKHYWSKEPFGILYQTQDRSDDVGLHNLMAESGFGSIYRQSLVYAVEVVPERYAALTRAAFQGANQALVDQVVRARAP